MSPGGPTPGCRAGPATGRAWASSTPAAEARTPSSGWRGTTSAPPTSTRHPRPVNAPPATWWPRCGAPETGEAGPSSGGTGFRPQGRTAMPQGVPLHIPFPSRISPDFDRALACHLDWPRSFGLLPTPGAERRHLRCNYGELAARFHPSATGTDLDLAIDQQSWYFVFD